MPELEGVHDAIQADGYSFSGRLHTPSRDVVLEGTVANPAGFTTNTGLAYFYVSGDHLDVQVNMEVEVFAPSGRSKGRLRVAHGPILYNALPVNEISNGRLKPESGDTFKVYREWRLRDMLVGMNTFDKDTRIIYAGQNALVKPKLRTGGHWAGPCDEGEAYATVAFFAATLTEPGDPDSTLGDLAFLADVGAGTIVVGDATTGDMSVQFPPGKHWVDFTCTDTANGAVAVQHVCVIVEGDLDDSIPCSLDEVSGSRVTGWSFPLSVPLASYASVASLPDRQMVIYTEDEYRANGIHSYGNPIAGRSRIKALGFLNAESIVVNADEATVSFEVIAPLAILSQLPGFSQQLIDTTDANWQTYPNLSVLRAINYLLVWGTTLPELFDIDDRQATDAPFAELVIQQNPPYLQVMELIENVAGEFICDRSGRFFLQRKLTRDSATNRDAADELLTLTPSDVVEIRINRPHTYKSAQLLAYGFVQGANGAPLASIVNLAPAEAPSITSLERQIVPNQPALNNVAGWAYAEENSLYFGAPVPAEIEIDLRGGYDVGDFYRQWIKLSPELVDDIALIARGMNRYQVDVPSRILLQTVQISYNADDGEKQVTWGCSHETDGDPGTTVDVPPEQELPPYTLPDFTPQPLPFPSTPTVIPDWTGVVPINGWVLGRQAGAGAHKMVSFTPGTPGTINFVDISTGLDLTKLGYWGYSNLFNYKQSFATMEDGIYMMPDMDNPTSWSRLRTDVQLFGGSGRFGSKAGGSHMQNGWGAIATGVNGIVITFNNWTSSALYSINGASVSGQGSWANDGQVDWALAPHNRNVIYALARSVIDNNWMDLFKSTDGGITWSLWRRLSTTGIDSLLTDVGRQWLQIPYKRMNGANNVDDANLEIWWMATGDVNSGQAARIQVSNNSGVSFAAAAYFSTRGDNTPSSIQPLTLFTHSSLYAWFVTHTIGFTENLSRTEDGLATVQSALISFGNVPYTPNANGWPMNPDCVFGWHPLGGSGCIRATVDAWVTEFAGRPASWVTPNWGAAYGEFSLFPFQ